MFFGMLLLNKRHMGTKLVYLRGLFLCFWWGTMLCVDSTMRYPSSLNLVLILPRHVSFMYPSSILPNFCSSVMCVFIQVPLLRCSYYIWFTGFRFSANLLFTVDLWNNQRITKEFTLPILNY